MVAWSAFHKVMEQAQSLWNRVSDALHGTTPEPPTHDDEENDDENPTVWLLGAEYKKMAARPAPRDTPVSAMQYSHNESFASDFHTRIWMTYRHGFPLIPRSIFTADAGWGCLIRCGQAMLAQALMVHSTALGRQWRIGQRGADDQKWLAYSRIIEYFLDDPSPKCPFSIHNLVLAGHEMLHIHIGQWYAPLTISQVIRELVNNIQEPLDGLSKLVCHIGVDGTLYEDQVDKLCELHNEIWSHSLLLLLPIRLGVDEINPIYAESLSKALELPQSLGIAGGKPNSALYFVGFNGLDYLYLDPHVTRPALRKNDIANAYMTYHCDNVKRIKLQSMDPSLLVGFYCADRPSFKSLCESLKVHKNPMVGVHAVSPVYDEMLDIESESSSEAFE